MKIAFEASQEPTRYVFFDKFGLYVHRWYSAYDKAGFCC